MAFLQAFMGVMGDHMMHLESSASTSDASSRIENGAASAARSVVGPAQSSSHEEPVSRKSRLLIEELTPPAATTCTSVARCDSEAPRVPEPARSSPHSLSTFPLSHVSSTSPSAALPRVLGTGGLSADEVVRAAEAGQIASGDAEVRAVLTNRELMRVMSDPAVQRALAECSADGSKLAMYLRDPDMSKKLRMLAAHGLIRIER
jgi:hypothetical protein